MQRRCCDDGLCRNIELRARVWAHHALARRCAAAEPLAIYHIVLHVHAVHDDLAFRRRYVTETIRSFSQTVAPQQSSLPESITRRVVWVV